jgi:fructoselysine-6-P-deglycase FrlB-like protein
MKDQFSRVMPIGKIYPKGQVVRFLDRDRNRKWTSKLMNFLRNVQLFVVVFRKRARAGPHSSMFFDKISDLSGSFSVQYFAQLFIAQDMTRTAS